MNTNEGNGQPNRSSEGKAPQAFGTVNQGYPNLQPQTVQPNAPSFNPSAVQPQNNVQQMQIPVQQSTVTQMSQPMQQPMQAQMQQPTKVIIQQQPMVRQMQPVMGVNMMGMHDDPTDINLMTLLILCCGIWAACGFCCIDPVMPNQPKRSAAKTRFWICLVIYMIFWIVLGSILATSVGAAASSSSSSRRGSYYYSPTPYPTPRPTYSSWRTTSYSRY